VNRARNKAAGSIAGGFRLSIKSRNRKNPMDFCLLRCKNLQISVTYTKYAPSFVKPCALSCAIFDSLTFFDKIKPPATLPAAL